MGKFFMGLFFAIVCIALAFILWNGTVAQEQDFEGKVKQDISEIYKDPNSNSIPAVTGGNS
ncbi:hypothetical protein MKX73_19360 [Solibacillus sp. FSL W7-1436]|uniref:hypothetical protein n=1 Tax=Solibacillus sp. FSL W7-1436 TaxID=2921705 RepID=UPI0030F84FD8